MSEHKKSRTKNKAGEEVIKNCSMYGIVPLDASLGCRSSHPSSCTHRSCTREENISTWRAVSGNLLKMMSCSICWKCMLKQNRSDCAATHQFKSLSRTHHASDVGHLIHVCSYLQEVVDSWGGARPITHNRVRHPIDQGENLVTQGNTTTSVIVGYRNKHGPAHRIKLAAL